MLSLPRLRVRKKKEELDSVSNKKTCNTYGTIDGVKVGTEWLTRKECSGAGVHRPTVASIHVGPEGAYSILISGRHKVKDSGNSLIFSGINGRTTNDNGLGHWNTALALSVTSKLPVRVIRSSTLNNPYAPKTGFRYDGIYTVIKWWEENVKGRVRYQFKMLRLEGQDPPTWKSLLNSKIQGYESDSEEPRIVHSWHIRIQQKPDSAPVVEDIKPKVERINPLFAITGSPPNLEEIVLSDEESNCLQNSSENSSNTPEESVQIIHSFVDVDNLSSCTEVVEEVSEWIVEESSATPCDNCVYEDYVESKEVKVDINTLQEQGEFEEENTLGGPSLPSVELASVNQENSVCNTLPVIHNILSFAENSSQIAYETENHNSTVLTESGHSYTRDDNFIVLNNLNAIPEHEWVEENEEVEVSDEDPLYSQTESIPTFLLTNKDNSEERSSFEKEEMSDSDDKTLNQMEHKCFFDISLRDIVKMVSEMAGCPCSWTDKQQLSTSPNRNKPLLPPLLLDYLKTILSMAEGAGSGVYPNIVTSNEGPVENRSFQVKEMEVSHPSPVPPLPKPHTSLPATPSTPPPPSYSPPPPPPFSPPSPPPLPSSPPPPSPPFSFPSHSNTLPPTPILSSSPPLPPVSEISKTNIDSSDITVIPVVSTVSIGTNTSSDQNMCCIEQSNIGTNTNIVCVMSTSTMTDPSESSPASETHEDKGVQTDDLEPSDKCHVIQLSSELSDAIVSTTLPVDHQQQSLELTDPETDEELEDKGRQQGRKSKNDCSNEILTEYHPPLKKGKITCKAKAKVNCNNEGPSRTSEEYPVTNNSHSISEVEVNPVLNFEEEWAQPHLYKVNMSKTFDEICDELCRTLPENGERSRKKGTMSFGSRHNTINHIQLGTQKRHCTVRKRRRRTGFAGFTESQQRLSKMKTSLMYGFYIDNCNFRGWGQGSEKSFIADSHLNFDL